MAKAKANTVAAATKAAKEIGISEKDMTPPSAAVSGEVVTTTAEAVKDLQASLPPSEPSREPAFSIVAGITTDELRQSLLVQSEQRELIKQFIDAHLIVDIHYGKIHVIKDCPAYKRGECNTDYHYSKSVLFKPGQELIFSLFGITDQLERDEEAYQMLGNVQGLVAYKSVMYRGDRRVGEGRGAATLSTNNNDPNSTIKKAEKRARMDACLSLGFSAYFTQDLDDPEYKSQREMMNERARMDAESKEKDEFGLMPRDPKEAIDQAERKSLFAMILKYGVDKYYVVDSLKLNGIKDTAAMTSGQARMLMGLIKNGSFKKPDQPVVDPEPQTDPEDDVITDIDDSDLSAAIDESTAAAAAEAPVEFETPAITVDDDLKEFVSTTIDSYGLSVWGRQWLFTKICGRPLAKWDKLGDPEWRKAYDIVMAYSEGNFDIPTKYLSANAQPDPTPRNPSEPSLDPPPLMPPPDPTEVVTELFPGATRERPA